MIRNILEKYQVDYKTHGKNIGKGWIGVSPCPNEFCQDTRNHFGINLKKPQCKCFKCGFNNLTKAISILCRLSYKKAKKIISECYDLQMEEIKESEEKDESQFVKLYNSFGELKDIHRNYLISRNFDPDYIIQKYQIRASDNIGDFKYRIVIPIFHGNRIVNFIARDVTSKQSVRYLFCPDEISLMKKSELVYNICEGNDSVILVEGIFDAWRIGNSVISMLSTQYSKGQVSYIVKRKFKRIFILFDSDETGRVKSEELSNILSMYSKVENIELDSGDPADLTEDDVKYLKKELRIK